jgi:hypothetical protein
MAPPFYRPSEQVRIGPYSHDKRYVDKVGLVVRILEPELGEHRYRVLIRGKTADFLERTLRKIHCGGSWSDCVWQPDRTPRKLSRPTSWKEFK